jgi:hypothetical protein
MKRREFITLLCGAAAAWPRAARAQPATLPVIGFFSPNTALAASSWTAAFVQRLRELGWIEGPTVAIAKRWGDGRVDVIVTHGESNVFAAKQAGAAIVDVIVDIDDFRLPLVEFLPGIDVDRLLAHRDSLEPDFLDLSGNALRSAIQSFVIRLNGRTILVDTCVGEAKEHVDHVGWNTQKADALGAYISPCPSSVRSPRTGRLDGSARGRHRPTVASRFARGQRHSDRRGGLG